VKKKIFSKIIASIVLSVILVVSCMPIYAGNGLTDATVKSYEEQLAEIARRKKEAENALASLRATQSDIWTEIAAIDQVLEYNTQLKTLAEGQIEVLNVQITEKNQTIESTQQSIDTQRQEYLDRMVYNYMDQDTDYIELILGSKNLVDFLTRMDRVNAILDHDRKVIQSLAQSKATLEKEKLSLDEAKQTQEQRLAELKAVIAENEALSESKYQYMKSVEADQSKWTEIYTYNLEQEQKLNKELEEYLEELQRKQNQGYVGGALGWPIELGADYFISSEFGGRWLQGVWDTHYGIDIACYNGTNIRAANSGKVLKSEMHWSYGNYILIDHGGGVSTLYAHMSDRLFKVGDTVQKGQIIGHCGLTGNTFGYHLHFEVREYGKVVEPRNYIVTPNGD